MILKMIINMPEAYSGLLRTDATLQLNSVSGLQANMEEGIHEWTDIVIEE
jgi:hypothetical protein